MKFAMFAALFGGTCVAIAIAPLALRPPTSSPSPDNGPTSPPSSWPDYSLYGAGFVTPDVPDGALIAYGYNLVTRTYALIGPEVFNPQMRFAGNNLACQNCHLDGGTKASGLPLVGIYRTYPKFSQRSQRVISLPERLNECMTRSMNGRALPDDSREMAALLAYLRFIGDPPAVPWVPAEPAPLAADAGRGAEIFSTICATCHEADGLGKRVGSANDARGYAFPPLWGPDSFNTGAGMDQDRNLVGFVRRNMPRGVDPQHPQLTLQQAWDVAAYVRSQPRPQFKPDTAGSRSP